MLFHFLFTYSQLYTILDFCHCISSTNEKAVKYSILGFLTTLHFIIFKFESLANVLSVKTLKTRDLKTSPQSLYKAASTSDENRNYNEQFSHTNEGTVMKIKKRYFVSKIVLTYCEKKLF